MRDSFYVVAPDISTVGESGTAYFQRFLVIALGLTCSFFSYYIWLSDCQVFRVVTSSRPRDYVDDMSSISNFTDTVGTIFEAFGLESREDKIVFDDDAWKEYEAVTFGGYGFKEIDYDKSRRNQNECKPYSDTYELSEEEQFYYRVIWTMATISPIFGFSGVICASIEMLFFVFYPSVILGSVFLSLAACTELTWLLMFAVDLRDCFTERRCYLGSNFWGYLLIVGGYFFSSCLLIFGLRTYPWCLRKKRSHNNCKIIEPEILSEEEILEQEHRWSSILGKSSRYSDLELFDNKSAPMEESYSDLKNKLDETHRKLVQSEEECRGAIARAEKAEALLEAYTNNTNHVTFEELKGGDEDDAQIAASLEELPAYNNRKDKTGFKESDGEDEDDAQIDTSLEELRASNNNNNRIGFEELEGEDEDDAQIAASLEESEGEDIDDNQIAARFEELEEK